LYNIRRMEILLNGRSESVEESITISKLIEEIIPAGKRVAVEVNEEIVPRTRHGAHVLNAGDRVEIVQAIGGG